MATRQVVRPEGRATAGENSYGELLRLGIELINSCIEVDMKWITRENVKVDRVACPWLIRRFVDREADFLFVPESKLLETAERAAAIPFDAPRIAAIKLNHRGERCSFEAIIEDYRLTAPGLKRLALIVRAADVKGQEHVAPEGAGLRAIAHGMAALGIGDEERLAREFPIYDALLAYACGLE
jgi:hypothetical protein